MREINLSRSLLEEVTSIIGNDDLTRKTLAAIRRLKSEAAARQAPSAATRQRELDRQFLALAGSWKADERSADEIVEEIERSRTRGTNRHLESLDR